MLTDRSDRALLAALSLNFVLFGSSMTLFGASIPEIIREYSWSYTAAGIVLAASAIGYFTSTFLSGLLLPRLGSRGLLLGTLVLEAAGFFFFARFPSLALNTALNFAIGLGQGGTEVVSNYAVIRMERDGRSRIMNLMHAAFCVGAIFGPLGVAGLLESSLGWRTVFPAMGVLLVAMTVAFAFTEFRTMTSPRAGDAEPGELGESRAAGSTSVGGTRTLVVMFSITILLYVGVELSLSNWVAEYFVRDLGTTARWGASMVALLWVGLLAGRLGISWLYRGERQQRVLVALGAWTSVALVLLLGSRSAAAAAGFVVLLGLGLSGVYPLVMTLVGKTMPSSVAIGIVSTAGGIGSFTFPFILAGIGDVWGLRAGFVFCLGVALAMIGASVVIALLIRRREATRG